MESRSNERLRVLLIGNGGREHALAWKLSQSPRVEQIFVAPGNGGTAGVPKVRNEHLQIIEFDSLVRFAKDSDVNLVVAGPEVPLVNGIESHFRAAGLRFFGPTQAASRLEGSKTFAKDFMVRHDIPTARYRNFSDYAEAKQYLDSAPYAVVLKASGLAAGKGVIIPQTKKEARSALESIMLSKEFGAAGDEVVIEEFLVGDELSFLSFSDGYTIQSLPAAQDHKQIRDNDEGPMTGGMGAYAPAPIATPQLVKEVHRTILQPTIDGMRKERMPFVGLLFTGLMITKDGPRVLEYNVRFGDPESQTLLPLMDADLAEVMVACTEGWLDNVHIRIKPESCATVIAAAGGYPGSYERGHQIDIDQEVHETGGKHIFHAGTSTLSATLKTAGGRVLAATCTAEVLQEAVSRAYDLMSKIHFKDMHFRKDIGRRALSGEPKALKNSTSMTYASAGVSISAGNDLVERIKPLVAATARPGASAELGGFGGTFDLHAAGYSSTPNIITSTDGVGTKLFIAQAINKHDTIGIDLVAMNVNDIVVQGAEPLWLTDIYSCGTLDVTVATDVVRGICDGCREANCALVAGETAEMGALYKPGEYDLGATANGALERGRTVLPDKQAMRAGDVLLALASNGVHSNGYSLVRKIVARAGLSYTTDPAPWITNSNSIDNVNRTSVDSSVGASLLTPTRIYVRPVLRAVRKDLIKGMAHITGGGLLENIPRMLPRHLAADLDAHEWEVPPVLRWLKKEGQVADVEFARVFNTGLGMVCVVAAEKVEEAVRELEGGGGGEGERGEREVVCRVGTLVEKQEGSEGCVVRNMEVWN